MDDLTMEKAHDSMVEAYSDVENMDVEDDWDAIDYLAEALTSDENIENYI